MLCGLASLTVLLSLAALAGAKEQGVSLTSWSTEEGVCLGVDAPASQGQVSGVYIRNGRGL